MCVVGMELQDFFWGLRGDMAKLYIYKNCPSPWESDSSCNLQVDFLCQEKITF